MNEMLAGIRQQHWSEQGTFLSRFIEAGGVAHFVRDHNVGNSFCDDDHQIYCIDEGVRCHGIHLAGSGILLGQDYDSSMEKAIDFMNNEIRRFRPTGITSHAGCGAAGLAFERYGKGSFDNPTQLAIHFSQQLARELGIQHRHIAAEEMKRPLDLHNARVIYYDGTSYYTPCDNMPTGFQISRWAIPSDVGKYYLDLAVQIAFGPHGFGDRFTSQEPLLVIPIGDSRHCDFRLEKLTAEALEATQKYGSRVRVEGFIAPEKIQHGPLTA